MKMPAPTLRKTKKKANSPLEPRPEDVKIS